MARDGSPLDAVDRALVALQELAESGSGGLALAELATRLQLAKPTLHRTLAALKYRGFVTQDASGRYLLGAAAARLGALYFGEPNLPRLLRPVLTALCAETGELVHLGVLAGTEVVYLDKVEPERAIRVWSAVGRRMPAATTALGRAILAFRGADAGAVRRYALDAGRELDPGALLRSVESARRQGYAVESEENEPGVACVAVPVLRDGDPIAAVSVTAPVERMGPARVPELAGLLTRVAVPLLPEGLQLPAQGG